MTKWIKWCEENTTVYSRSDDTMIGVYNVWAYRIFIDEGWAAIGEESRNGTWDGSDLVYSFEEFLERIER